ncbi:MAG: hypothetical protein FD145_1085 [Candidatus Saganbacteria bacterium]|uniref:DNA alkylation repair protein n=1 Tax=Candidatus Saganbacteria bacterium TaxID=2575572 RepID=A0A833NRQ6_UNCSA|nr:MAG: hypothetical protein FD145_1085 [Candidatus Saganbacteria bacterium]
MAERSAHNRSVIGSTPIGPILFFMAENRILIFKIKKLLDSKINAEYLKKVRVFIPSDKKIVGVRVPDIRLLVNEFQSKNKLTLEECLNLIDSIVKEQVREELLFGFFLLAKYKKQIKEDIIGKVDGWINYIENWETCDQLATVINFLFAQNTKLLKILDKWSKSENFWRRRFVLAVCSTLNHKGNSSIHNDDSIVDEVLKICQNLITDSEEMVEKALHWAIRETSKKDPEKVLQFLLKNKNKMKPRIVKESAKKLPEKMKAIL